MRVIIPGESDAAVKLVRKVIKSMNIGAINNRARWSRGQVL
jgi:hypothetical protein